MILLSTHLLLTHIILYLDHYFIDELHHLFYPILSLHLLSLNILFQEGDFFIDLWVDGLELILDGLGRGSDDKL